MKPAATLALYAGALAVVFGAAVGVGNAVGPVGPAASADTPRAGDHAMSGAATDHGTSTDGALRRPKGLAVSQDGYTLRLDSAVHPAGRAVPLTFSITGPDGERLTELSRSHDEELHLIVVRRDLTGYQHLHPTRDAQGRWRVPLALTEPGPYKVFADFTPAGHDDGLTLAADLTVPGEYTPAPLPSPARTASVDEYEVSLDGTLVLGTSSELTLSVRRDGEAVTDLQPYLGAYGHLVALREGDLAYLHVHPDGGLDEPGTTSGPELSFAVDVPSPSAYRLFLDFSHGGQVRTAEFTAVAERAGTTGSRPATPGSPAPPQDSAGDAHDH